MTLNLEQRKARILWHSRRGMLELDLLLGRYLRTHLDTMSVEEMDRYEDLLTYPDPDLFAWLMGYETPCNKELADYVAAIRSLYSNSSLS